MLLLCILKDNSRISRGDYERTQSMAGVDHLHGLKENVIIGRKIPVGTGVKPLEVEEEIAVPSEEDIAGL